MLARSECLECLRCVQLERRGEHHRVNVGLGEELLVGLIIGQLGVLAAPLREHASINIADAGEAHPAIESAQRRPREARPPPRAHNAQHNRFLHHVVFRCGSLPDFVRASPPGPLSTMWRGGVGRRGRLWPPCGPPAAAGGRAQRDVPLQFGSYLPPGSRCPGGRHISGFSGGSGWACGSVRRWRWGSAWTSAGTSPSHQVRHRREREQVPPLEDKGAPGVGRCWAKRRVGRDRRR